MLAADIVFKKILYYVDNKSLLLLLCIFTPKCLIIWNQNPLIPECLHGFIYRLLGTFCLYEYKWDMWPSKYAAQKQLLFLCIVAHSHHSVAAVSFDCTQQNRFMNKYEKLYMCSEIRRILVFHVQRLYFSLTVFLSPSDHILSFKFACLHNWRLLVYSTLL